MLATDGRVSRRTGCLMLILLSAMALSTAASAQTLTTLVNFNGSNGNYVSQGGVIADANGNLFGLTETGGAYGYGTVFEISKTAGGYASAPTTLVSFNMSDGGVPDGGLIVDANGNLFGTTAYGGAYGDGTVFEVAKTTTGYASTPTILASFDGGDGEFPLASLIADASGNLFSTTQIGGASYVSSTSPGIGTVFEIAKTVGVYADTPTTLVNFDGGNGDRSEAPLLADAGGNLYGTTTYGGASYASQTSPGYGTVFEIAKTTGGYASTPTTLVSFNYSDGFYPDAGLIADANGDLFGTAEFGGPSGYGTVFEIAKTADGYASTPITLVNFNFSDGAYPDAGLIADANGNLFGTTIGGGASGNGTVFEIVKIGTGYASTPTTLVSFDGTNGWYRISGLTADADGNLFGTTTLGGTSYDPSDPSNSPGYGTVFEITGSGFVPASTPQQQISSLEAEVNTLASDGWLNQGQDNSLLKQLNNALRSLGTGNTAAAISQIQDFISEVQSLMSDGTLTQDQGQPLIDAANALIHSLGG
jgi:uncharacterized repeat protein (TIGR03803 family)